jgi:tetratricopeptide (TPR) repeat protein
MFVMEIIIMKRPPLDNQSAAKKQKTTASSTPDQSQSQPPYEPNWPVRPFRNLFKELRDQGITTLPVPTYRRIDAEGVVRVSSPHPLVLPPPSNSIDFFPVMPNTSDILTNIKGKNYDQAWNLLSSAFDKNYTPYSPKINIVDLLLRDIISQCRKTNSPDQFLQSLKPLTKPPFLEVIQGNIKKAQNLISRINAAIQQNPDLIYAYLLRGCTYYYLNDDSNAVTDFKTSVEKHPYSAPAYYLLAISSQKEKDKETQLNYISKYLTLEPNNLSAYFVQGSLNNKVHNYSLALIDLYKVIAFSNKNSNLYFHALVMQAKIQSISGHSRVLLLPEGCKIPTDDPLEKNTIYLKSIQDKNSTEEKIEAYWCIPPWFGKGTVLLHNKKIAFKRMALKNLPPFPKLGEKAIAIEQEDILNEIRSLCGCIPLRCKEQVVADLNSLLINAPKEIHASIYQLRGSVHFQLKNSPQALSDFSEVIRLGQANAYTYYHIGRLYAQQGNDIQAYEHLSKAYSMDQSLFSLQQLVSLYILKNHGKVYSSFGLSFFIKNKKIPPARMRAVFVRNNITPDTISHVYEINKQTCHETLIEKLDGYEVKMEQSAKIL